MSVFRRDISIVSIYGDNGFKIESTVCSVYRVYAMWKIYSDTVWSGSHVFYIILVISYVTISWCNNFKSLFL